MSVGYQFDNNLEAVISILVTVYFTRLWLSLKKISLKTNLRNMFWESESSET